MFINFLNIKWLNIKWIQMPFNNVKLKWLIMLWNSVNQSINNLSNGLILISTSKMGIKHKPPCSAELFITNLIQNKVLFKDFNRLHKIIKRLALFSLLVKMWVLMGEQLNGEEILEWIVSYHHHTGRWHHILITIWSW